MSIFSLWTLQTKHQIPPLWKEKSKTKIWISLKPMDQLLQNFVLADNDIMNVSL